MKTLRPLIHFAALVAVLLTLTLTAGPHALGQAYQWENFAGSNGGLGDRNAAGSAARFYLPNGTVLAPGGNIFVADTSNFTIRQVTPDGVVTTFAGLAGATGHVDAAGALARFSSPNGIAVDAVGNLYVSDSVTVRRITPGGAVDTLAGTANIPGHLDGGPGVALLFAPSGLAVRPLPGGLPGDVEVYMTDHGFHTIRRITVVGGLATGVTTIAGGAGQPGSSDNAVGTAARFSNPTGLALSADGNTLFVADTTNNSIRAITLSGLFPVNRVAGTPGTFGTEDGVASAARFNGPTAVALDPSGTALAIVDSGNQLVRVMLLSNFQVNTLAGTPLTNGSRDASAADLAFGTKARFFFYTVTGGTNGAAYEANGNLIIADSFNHTLRRISTTGHVTTPVGRANETGYNDGGAASARFHAPTGLALEPGGPRRLIVADTSNHAIRGIAPDGIVSFISGTIRDSGPTVETHYYPGGVAVDSQGRILVADSGYSRIVRLLSNGTPDVTFNGLGGAGPGGLPGSAAIGTPGVGSNMDGPLHVASFAYPQGVAEDPTNGRIYVADTSNHTIRRIDLAVGMVSTIGGAEGATGRTDGPGALSRFNGPTSLVVDTAGIIYVADTTNNLIRRMTPDGSGGFTVDTLAGTGNTFFNDGVGTAASFYTPRGIALDGVGNLYVADNFNQVVRKIVIGPGNTSVVTTLGGRIPSLGNQGGLGPEAMFYAPLGIAAEADGTVYLSTNYSHGIFVGKPPVTLPPVLTQPADNKLTRSPVTVAFELPEAARSSSVKLSFGAGVLTLAAGMETAGAHSFSFHPANPLASPEIAAGPAIADGTYTVTLSYGDTAGAPLASDVSLNVTIDTTPPETTITSAPALAAQISLASFAFTSNEAGAVFRGGFDGDPFTPLTSPQQSIVSAGAHSFKVAAVDLAGNEDPTPAIHDWRVTFPPILTHPVNNKLTRSPVAVEFTLKEAARPGSLTLGFGAQVLRLASGLETAGTHAFSFDPANPPASPAIAAGPAIPDGTYTATLTYEDTVGGPPAIDESLNVTIDTTPPETTITSAPAAATPSALAPFAFTSNEAGVVFNGRLDTNPFTLLSGPQHYIVSAGAHTFGVFAVDAAGNEDASPATHAWTVTPTAIGNWRDLRFGLTALDAAIAGNLSDPDGDGILNLREYLGGTDPLSASSMPDEIWKLEGSAITLIHERSIAATDAIFGIEKSEHIGGWTDANFTEEVLSSNSVTRRVKVTVPLVSNNLNGPRGFLRGKVSVPP